MATILEPDLYEISTTFLAFVLFLLTLMHTQRFHENSNKKKNRKMFPPHGPREWPIIGIIPSLVGDEPYKLLAEMSTKYGPMFMTRIGMVSTLVINDYEVMKEALVKSGDDFADRPRFGMMEYITKGRGIISAHVGDSQREKRRFGLGALRALGMGKSHLMENIVDEVATLCDIFANYNGKPFKPGQDITVSVSNIICWIEFGRRFKHDDGKFRRSIEILQEGFEICESTGIVGFIPWLQKLPLPVWRKLARNDKEWWEYTAAWIAESLKRPSTEEPCFVQMYLGEMNKEKTASAASSSASSDGAEDTPKDKSAYFTEEDMRQTLGDLFAAGTDTTAVTLKWAILYLILHPDVQRKIHEELDRVVGRSRMPTLDDRKSIPYTDAVLLEVQRKATIVPLSVPHCTSWDAKITGYDVPAGTLVLPNIWAIHHDPKIWKSPEEFRPERFLDERGTTVIQREHLVPFCIGRRKCLGEQLAKMELYIFFTHLLHRFEFRSPEGAATPSTVGRPGATRTPVPYDVCAILRF